MKRSIMDIQKLFDTWLADGIDCIRIGEYYEVSIPYPDRANDYLQVYLRQKGDSILITDNGMTLHRLEMEGIRLEPEWIHRLQSDLDQYGVELDDGDLTIETTLDNFGKIMHQFILAMLHVEDMAEAL